jgi:hypothetical protein
MLVVAGVVVVGATFAIGWRWRWFRIATWLLGTLVSIATLGGGIAILGSLGGGEPEHHSGDGALGAYDGIGRVIGGAAALLLIAFGLFGLVAAIKSAVAYFETRPPRPPEIPAARVVGEDRD